MTGRPTLAAYAAALAAVAAGASPAAAQELPGAPFVEFTNLPAVSTFPDSRSTRIYTSTYQAGPGAETVIRGRAPRARYWSFSAQDQSRGELDVLYDEQVALGPGETYELVVRTDCAGRANCLETGTGPATAAPARVNFRLYVPRGDGCGGAGLPAVTVRPLGAARSALSGTSATTGEDAAPCPPRPPGIDARFASAAVPARDVAPGETAAPPAFSRYEVTSTSGAGGTGDNAYVFVSHDLAGGNLLIRARAPTHRDSRARRRREQVRYWSICTFQLSRPVDCRRDEEVALGPQRRFTIIVAPACPVRGYANCLRAGAIGGPAGPAATTGARTGGPVGQAGQVPNTVVVRNLLASPAFANEAGPRVCPRAPSQFCGAYLPRADYVPRPTPPPRPRSRACRRSASRAAPDTRRPTRCRTTRPAPGTSAR